MGFCNKHNTEYTDFCYDCYSARKENVKCEYFKKKNTPKVNNCINGARIKSSYEINREELCVTIKIFRIRNFC